MMETLFAFGRKLWSEAQWRAPAWMQRSIMPHLSIAREYAILALRPYLTACQLKGQSKDGPMAITYAIHGADTELKLYLASNLFVERPVEEEIGRVPLWRLRELTSASSSDLTFIGASKYLIRRLDARNAIVLPRMVDQILDVRGEWEDVLQQFHKTTHKNELRLVRKYGYEYETSNKDKDFEMFFHKMYLPLMRERHGHQAHLTPYVKAYKRFKHGVLFLVKREGAYVSGVLCDNTRDPGVVHFLLVGVLKADQQLMKEGAQSALYHAVIHWSNKRGYEAVDFEAAEPYLRKGILQYKKKWGAAARIWPDMHKRIWIRVHHNTPSVRQFLKDSPCCIINEQGDLQGLFFTDEPDNVPPETRAEWDKLCAMPGLKGYLVRSVEDFIDQPTRVS